MWDSADSATGRDRNKITPQLFPLFNFSDLLFFKTHHSWRRRYKVRQEFFISCPWCIVSSFRVFRLTIKFVSRSEIFFFQVAETLQPERFPLWLKLTPALNSTLHQSTHYSPVWMRVNYLESAGNSSSFFHRLSSSTLYLSCRLNRQWMTVRRCANWAGTQLAPCHSACMCATPPHTYTLICSIHV